MYPYFAVINKRPINSKSFLNPYLVYVAGQNSVKMFTFENIWPIKLLILLNNHRQINNPGNLKQHSKCLNK